MSSKRARLVRIDNFKYLPYYNLYNNNKTSPNCKLQNYYSSSFKQISYFNSNRRSLLYSSIYKQYTDLSIKNTKLVSMEAYPLFMKTFLSNLSNLNYYNVYDVYNPKRFTDENFINNYNSLGKETFIQAKHITNKNKYGKQCWYFNTVYKHFIKHKYEHEDNNKLLYKACSRYSLNEV